MIREMAKLVVLEHILIPLVDSSTLKQDQSILEVRSTPTVGMENHTKDTNGAQDVMEK